MTSVPTIDFFIKSTWRNIVGYYNQVAANYDLTQASGFVLLQIDEMHGTAATKIGPLMGIKNTSLSRMLKKMEKDDLIFRKKDETDGRLVKVFLTNKGIEKKQQTKKVVKNFNESIVSNLSQKDIDCFHKVMDAINAQIEISKTK